jgi:S1-C subfamily serine protease
MSTGTNALTTLTATPAEAAPVLAADTQSRAIRPPGPGALLEDERNTIDIFEAVAPATVFVTQTQLVRDFWSHQAHEVPAGSGTGFIWDDQGHIVTNNHVTHGARGLTVTLHDGSAYEATVVGVEPRKDIAVLKIDAPASVLSAIQLPAKSDRPAVGQKALAIGNPFGLDHTLTTGVISALGREVLGFGGVQIRDMIQTDASINPGNSGGPLLDSGGNLLGMNTMIYSQSGQSAGIGFAVPVSTIRRIVPQIIETGQAEQVGMGIRILQDEVARRLGVRGVVVQDVVPGSPADKAGLRGLSSGPNGRIALGDVIVGIDDTPITSYGDLYNALDSRSAGDRARVRCLRDGQAREVSVSLITLD